MELKQFRSFAANILLCWSLSINTLVIGSLVYSSSASPSGEEKIEKMQELPRNYYLFQGRAEEYVQEAIRYHEQYFPVLTEERKKKFLADMDQDSDMVISELEAKLVLKRTKQAVKDLREYRKWG